MKWNLAKTIVMTALLAVLAQFALRAQGQPRPKQVQPRFTASYNFLIASGFLCEAADSCPAVAQDANGNSIEITGAGTLRLADKSITAAGAFTEKASSGTITATGVWTATSLVSFQPYGVDPFALLRDYPQLRTASPFSMGRPMMPRFMMMGPMGALTPGPLAAGGLAVIRARLLPDAGSPQQAVLQVNCAKGRAPENEETDGVKLTIAGGRAFNVPVAGHVVFLLLRPMPNFRQNVQK
jgi:hypothetical protein